MVKVKHRKAKLSKMREKIWKYLLDYIYDNGYSPSHTQIAVEMGTSRQNISVHLRIMEEDRYIQLAGQGKVGIQIIELTN